jgi:hypothetical protein
MFFVKRLMTLTCPGCKGFYFNLWRRKRAGAGFGRTEVEGQVCAHGFGKANESTYDTRGSLCERRILGKGQQSEILFPLITINTKAIPYPMIEHFLWAVPWTSISRSSGIWLLVSFSDEALELPMLNLLLKIMISPIKILTLQS